MPETKRNLISKIQPFDASRQFSCCHEECYHHLRTDQAKRKDDIIEAMVALDQKAEAYLQRYVKHWNALWQKYLDESTKREETQA